MLTLRMTMITVRPIYAIFLAIGAVIGVASSIVIMNLLVGYFAIARDAYVSLHPHIAIHGVKSDDEANALAGRLLSLDPRIRMAAPALHYQRMVVLASVKVATELCDRGVSLEANCEGDREASRAQRVYAYELKDVKQVEVQVRGVTIVNDDTVSDYRKLLSGLQNLDRLGLDKDTGGNVLPISFLAQDTLISEVIGTYLIAPDTLADRYERYYRLHGVLRLGAKSSGAPYLVLGLQHAKALAPPKLRESNVVEVRIADSLAAEDVSKVLKEKLGKDFRVDTWIDLERPAFAFLNATWVMVFSVMLSVCIVVAISIYSTLTLSVMRNRWKVALLGTMGFTPLRIAMIFLLFSFSVAFVGVLGGVVLGTYVSEMVGGVLYSTFLRLPPEKFAATMTWRPAAWMALATIAIFIFAAVSPARRATRIRPAEALSERN